MTYQVKGGQNKNYKILRKEAMLPNSAAKAIASGKETTIYYLQGITRTGKTSKEVIMCFRYNTGSFIKVL